MFSICNLSLFTSDAKSEVPFVVLSETNASINLAPSNGVGSDEANENLTSISAIKQGISKFSEKNIQATWYFITKFIYKIDTNSTHQLYIYLNSWSHRADCIKFITEITKFIK